MVEIKLKKPNALIQNQSVKSNQAVKPKHPFKKRFSVFSPRWLNLKRVQIFAFLYTL